MLRGLFTSQRCASLQCRSNHQPWALLQLGNAGAVITFGQRALVAIEKVNPSPHSHAATLHHMIGDAYAGAAMQAGALAMG